jgi:hypothetical protein
VPQKRVFLSDFFKTKVANTVLEVFRSLKGAILNSEFPNAGRQFIISDKSFRQIRMVIIENTCRFCLKSTPKSELIPLFEQTYNGDNGDWKRIAHFVYPAEGVPGAICSTCHTQLRWVVAYQRQIYENDYYLRSLAANNWKYSTKDDMDFEQEEDEIVSEYSSDPGNMSNDNFEYRTETPDESTIHNMEAVTNGTESDLDDPRMYEENAMPRVNGNKFQCFCGKKFTKKKYLNRHKKTHKD